MPSFWTRFVRESEVEPPSPEVFERALNELAKWLRFELRRRHLFSSPPRFLGLVGGSLKERDTFTDLLHDAYLFCVIERQGALRRLAKTREIDGAIRKNVSVFLHERQRRADPVGYRVFEITRRAAAAAIEKGDLESSRGGTQRGLSARDLLILPPFDADPEPGPIEEDLLARWCESLMPDLVSAFHRGPVVDHLAALIPTLSDTDISAFLLRDLARPLIEIARRRSVATLTSGVVSIASGDQHVLDFPIPPNHRLEERQVAEALLRCIRDHIEKRRHVKEQSYLHRLLDFLAAWSAMMEEGAPRGRPGDAELARRLEIPRGRVGDLRRTLSQMASDCRAGHSGTGGGSPQGSGGSSPPSPAGARSEAMDRHQRQEALRRATLGRGEARPDVAPGGGELETASVVTWREDPEAKQWLVLPSGSGRRRLVPVDDAPWRGSRDFDLSVQAGEPLVARCGLALDVLPTPELEILWRLPQDASESAIDAVEARIAELQGTAPPMVEIDGESVYQRHLEAIRDVRTRLEAAHGAPSAGDENGGGSFNGAEPVDDGAAHAESPENGNVLPFASPRAESAEKDDAGLTSSRHPAWVTWLSAAACAALALGLGFQSHHLGTLIDESKEQLEVAEVTVEASKVRPIVERAPPIYMGTTRSSGRFEHETFVDDPDLGIGFSFQIPPQSEHTDLRLEIIDDASGRSLRELAVTENSSVEFNVVATMAPFTAFLNVNKNDGAMVEIYTEKVRIIPSGDVFDMP
ncbi:MAG: hypothetical protein AAGM22_26480 [Acidobacteriota bacterium]